MILKLRIQMRNGGALRSYFKDTADSKALAKAIFSTICFMNATRQVLAISFCDIIKDILNALQMWQRGALLYVMIRRLSKSFVNNYAEYFKYVCDGCVIAFVYRWAEDCTKSQNMQIHLAIV